MLTTAELIPDGNKLFETKPTFWRGVVSAEQLPDEMVPEIAFAGRSNVGKSTLINTITGCPKLARASNTPGRTQELNFFHHPAGFYLVDLPGYGFASAPRQTVQVWTHLIHDYLRGRRQLRRVFLLIDIRHGVKPVDENIMKMMDRAAVNYQIVLTKADKVSPTVAAEMLDRVSGIGAGHVACYPEVLMTSSETKTDIGVVRAQFIKVLRGI